MTDIKFLAYYLPQYHPIPENDEWWGKGFTEWTNVTKAKPLFKGHYQPILPGELGFYDLRLPQIQEQQAALAQEYGVDGFIYYHYWFGKGKQVLQTPAEKMLHNKNIQLPFCMCWANETWKGVWHGLSGNTVLAEQQYLGEADVKEHFNYLLPFFRDSRYIKVDGKPMFQIYLPEQMPESKNYLNMYRNLAVQAGFPDLYIVGGHWNHAKTNLANYGLDAITGLDIFHKMRYKSPYTFSKGTFAYRLEKKLKTTLGITDDFDRRTKPQIWDYQTAVSKLAYQIPENYHYLPCVFPNWDNSARSGKRSLIFKNVSPKFWGQHLQQVATELAKSSQPYKCIIIKSWNEWAEGNHLEPDARFGREWLEVTKQVKNSL